MNTAPKLTVMSDTRFIPAAATPAIEVLSAEKIYSNGTRALLPVCSRNSPRVRTSSRSRQLRSRASSSQLTKSTYWQHCRPVTKLFRS